MLKSFRWLILAVLLCFLTWASYNYYYYHKAQKLNKDIYAYLEIVLKNLDNSLEKLEEKDIDGFLLSNYQMVRHSNYLKEQNQKIYSNVFVKMNLMNDGLFSSELSESLLWFNKLNTKLNNFYVLSNSILTFEKISENDVDLSKNMASIKSTILDINSLVFENNEQIVSIAKNRNLEEDAFLKLKAKLQNTNSFFEILSNVLGEKKKTNTLVVFQNPKNINASGGKWIYYSVMECDKYQCKFSPLDLVSNITASMIDKLIPPEEIKTQKSVWAYEDLGWFFDFNETGRLALKYYPVKTQLHGVMALNVEIFEEVLKKTEGFSFELDDKKIEVNKSNIVELLLEYSVAKNNKEMSSNMVKIDAFWKAFEAKISSQGNAVDIFGKAIFDFLASKKAQIFYAQNIVKSVNDLNFNNNLKSSVENNYFALVRNNILDQSLDHNIAQKVNLKVEISDDDFVYSTAKINIANKNSTKIRSTVYSYMQIVLRKGIEILETDFPSKVKPAAQVTVDYKKHGFLLDPKIDSIAMKSAYLKDDAVRIYEDGNYLVSGGWALTQSQNSKNINFSWKEKQASVIKDNTYKLFVQSQPNVSYVLNLEIEYPSGVEDQKNTILKSYVIDKDRLIEIKID